MVLSLFYRLLHSLNIGAGGMIGIQEFVSEGLDLEAIFLSTSRFDADEFMVVKY